MQGLLLLTRGKIGYHLLESSGPLQGASYDYEWNKHVLVDLALELENTALRQSASDDDMRVAYEEVCLVIYKLLQKSPLDMTHGLWESLWWNALGFELNYGDELAFWAFLGFERAVSCICRSRIADMSYWNYILDCTMASCWEKRSLTFRNTIHILDALFESRAGLSHYLVVRITYPKEWPRRYTPMHDFLALFVWRAMTEDRDVPDKRNPWPISE